MIINAFVFLPFVPLLFVRLLFVRLCVFHQFYICVFEHFSFQVDCKCVICSFVVSASVVCAFVICVFVICSFVPSSFVRSCFLVCHIFLFVSTFLFFSILRVGPRNWPHAGREKLISMNQAKQNEKNNRMPECWHKSCYWCLDWATHLWFQGTNCSQVVS